MNAYKPYAQHKIFILLSAMLSASGGLPAAYAEATFSATTTEFTELNIPIADAGTLGFFSVRMRLSNTDPITFQLTTAKPLTRSPTSADGVYNPQTGMLSIPTVITDGMTRYTAELQGEAVGNLLQFRLTRLTQHSTEPDECEGDK